MKFAISSVPLLPLSLYLLLAAISQRITTTSSAGAMIGRNVLAAIWVGWVVCMVLVGLAASISAGDETMYSGEEISEGHLIVGLVLWFLAVIAPFALWPLARRITAPKPGAPTMASARLPYDRSAPENQ